MAVHYSIQGEGDTLTVNAWGFDESLAQVEEYGMAVISACIEGGYTHVLCNEVGSSIVSARPTPYEDAAFMSAHAPRVARVAIVCNPKFIADARFFEDVAINRRLTVRVFKEVEDASWWLNDSATAERLRTVESI